LIDYLEAHRIQTALLFAGNITRQPAFQDIERRLAGKLDNTDAIMHRTLWMGLYPGLGDLEMQYIIDTIDGFIELHK